MKSLIIPFLLFGVIFFNAGCWTKLAATNIAKAEYTQMEAEMVWVKASSQIAISGYRYTSSHKKKECYLVIPVSLMEKLKNRENEVMLSQIGHIRTEDLANVAIIDGKVPDTFIPLTKKDALGKSVFADKRTSFNPGAVLALPFAIVADVITFPIQIKFAHSWENVN